MKTKKDKKRDEDLRTRSFVMSSPARATMVAYRVRDELSSRARLVLDGNRVSCEGTVEDLKRFELAWWAAVLENRREATVPDPEPPIEVSDSTLRSMAMARIRASRALLMSLSFDDVTEVDVVVENT